MEPTERPDGRKTMTPMSPRFLKDLMGGWMGALVGACFYGSLVTAVNWEDGVAHALRSGVGHGAVSAGLTLFGTSWMRLVFYKHFCSPHRSLITFLAGMGLTYALLLSIHTLLGTPRLFLSLMPGVIPNILFCAAYSSLLARTANPISLAELNTSNTATMQGCTS